MSYPFFCAVVYMLLWLPCFGQLPAIEWGEFQDKSNKVLKVDTQGSGNFYALRESRKGILGSIQISAHKNLETVVNEKVLLWADGSPANFEGTAIVGGRYVVLLSDKKGGRNIYYLQEYDEDAEPIGDLVELVSFDVEGPLPRFSGDFGFSQSENKEFLAVAWVKPEKGKSQLTYCYQVFDKNLSVASEGEFQIPFDLRYFRISALQVSDIGDFFTVICEYQKSNNQGIIVKHPKFEAVHVYQFTKEGPKDTPIDLRGNYPKAITTFFDEEDNIIVVGTWGEEPNSFVNGLFYLKLDSRNNETLLKGMSQFDEKLITKGWSDRRKKKIEKKRGKGKVVNPALSSFSLRDLYLAEDGGIVGSMERNYAIESGHFYEDVIAFKIKNKGGIEWATKFEKCQYSSGDMGYFSSYVSYIDGDELVFILNDNIKYYKGNGAFNDELTIKNTKSSMKKYTLAIVRMDIKTGEYSRKISFDQHGMRVVPKIANVNYNKGEVLMYAINGNKEKFGILRFGNE